MMMQQQDDHRIFGGCGLGTFPFTGAFGPLSNEGINSILDAYFSRGGVYLDTAPTYGFGETEKKLGEYLGSRPRDSYAISTSCGYVKIGDKYEISGKAEHVRRDLEESLERLKLQYVDIYISHIPDPNTPLHLTMRELNRAKEEGLAKYIGVSNVSSRQIKEYLIGGPFDIVQNRFSFLNRTIDDEMSELCIKNNIKVIAYQVIERGILTSRGPAAVRKNANDLRNKKPEFSEESLKNISSLVQMHIQPIAERLNTTIESLMTKWAVHAPPVALAQLGAKSVNQIMDMPIGEQVLASTVVQELEDAYRLIEEAVTRQQYRSIRAAMGLEGYDIAKSGSASGS